MTVRSDIIARAHRRLAVLSINDSPNADQVAFASRTLDDIFDELVLDHGIDVDWTPDTAPAGVRVPLAWLLAVDIAPQYSVASEPRSRAMGRVRSVLFPDDRTDSRDIDGDGTVSTAEDAAGDASRYY